MTPEPNDPTRAGSPLPSEERVLMSQTEIETLCTKAARGAGMSWGNAEEAGFAVGWLHARSIDGASALLAHLERTEGAAWRDVCPVIETGHWHPSGAEPLCPVALGVTLCDFRALPEAALTGGGLTLGPVSRPLILVPFLAEVARLSGPLTVSWDGGAMEVTADSVLGNDIAGLVVTTLVLSAGVAASPAEGKPEPRKCDRAVLARLNDLAMKTTIPPSEKSCADAGAASSDND